MAFIIIVYVVLYIYHGPQALSGQCRSLLDSPKQALKAVDILHGLLPQVIHRPDVGLQIVGEVGGERAPGEVLVHDVPEEIRRISGHLAHSGPLPQLVATKPVLGAQEISEGGGISSPLPIVIERFCHVEAFVLQVRLPCCRYSLLLESGPQRQPPRALA